MSASQAASRVSRRAAAASAAESASGNADALEVVDPLVPNWTRSVAHSTASPSSRSIAPAQRAPMWMRSSTNHSLVSSSASPMPPRIADGRHADVLEDELRVAIGERVRVVGVVLDPQAGRVVVDQEEGRLALAAVEQMAVEDHEVGLVGRAGHEPLLAVQDVLAGRRVADGGGGQRPRVGAGARLGDGVGAEALAAQARLEVAPTLLVVHVD